ncbi:MAG TPA: hypothetical protein VE546_25960 [Streptomyces sp.]|nr:hypothetical protein [Streptomyces sp.]HZG06969.1 hypothetical protein [Streptomyces sp.]
MTRVKKFLAVLAIATAMVGLGTAPALAENHVPSPSPSQPLGG